jgi:inactive STAND
MATKSYRLETAGKEAIKDLWRLSGYPIDQPTESHTLYRAIPNLSHPTFKKLFEIIHEGSDQSFAMVSLQKFVAALSEKITDEDLNQNCRSFIKSLAQDHPNGEFLKIREITTSLSPPLDLETIANLLNQLDYETQQTIVADRISECNSRIIAFCLPEEEDSVGKWLIQRLRKKIHCENLRIVNFSSCEGSKLDGKSFCSEIAKALGLGDYLCPRYKRKPRKAENPEEDVMKRLEVYSRDKSVLMIIDRLENDEYESFFQGVYRRLESVDTGQARVFVLFSQCSMERIDYLKEKGANLLPFIDILPSDVETWLRNEQLVGDRTTLTIESINGWLFWPERERRKRLEELLLTLCASFRVDLRWGHLGKHLTTTIG